MYTLIQVFSSRFLSALDVNICTDICGILGDAVCKNCYHHYECFMINDIITASMSLVMIVQVAQAVGGFELTP